MTRPYTGRWFEELRPGLVIQHAIRRTITEADNVTFTTMTMNPAWLHLDFDYAANETEFGRPLVNTVANLGFREIAFPAPLFHGDTLHVETEVLEARPSKSRPRQGIATFEHRAYNQRDELVCRAVRDALMHCRPDQAPASAD
jgi:acyl dehydratase